MPHPLHRMKEHNVRLRERPGHGLSLSEKGFLRIGEGDDPLSGDDAELRTRSPRKTMPTPSSGSPPSPSCARTMVKSSALAAGSPTIRLEDLTGDLHSHSRTGRTGHQHRGHGQPPAAAGHAYQVLTDHSQSLTRSPVDSPPTGSRSSAPSSPQRSLRARGGSDGTAPPETPPEGSPTVRARIAQTASSIAQTTCWPGSTWSWLQRQSKAELTRRTLNEIRSPHV